MFKPRCPLLRIFPWKYGCWRWVLSDLKGILWTRYFLFWLLKIDHFILELSSEQSRVEPSFGAKSFIFSINLEGLDVVVVSSACNWFWEPEEVGKVLKAFYPSLLVFYPLFEQCKLMHCYTKKMPIYQDYITGVTVEVHWREVFNAV